MRRHIFADESGCLTFKNSPHVTKHFILCSIVTDSPNIGDELLALRRELAWEGLPVEVFHATTDKQAVRDRVFDLLAGLDFRIDATILEKCKARQHITARETLFYKYAWYYHFKHVGPQLVTKKDELHLTAASIGTKKKQAAFNDAVNDVARQVLGNIPHRSSFWLAASDPCLQIADYCAWALRRKWENGDERSYVLIQDKLHTEFELWAASKEKYY
ncbi:MAG: hypothetical protein CMP91_08485 [Gammaproteobacteria bacterium]|nr:hypothetical protein [Gammaproteobacteria bacterium]|tara:strand:- start:161115 stop:161765 length:651 start_codon:yes stop_codon:yes gene_type:complete